MSSEDMERKDAKSGRNEISSIEGQSEGQEPEIPSTPAKNSLGSTILPSDEHKVTPTDPPGQSGPRVRNDEFFDLPPLMLTITESTEGGVQVMSPPPKASLQTKIKLFFRGAYRRVTPSPTDLEPSHVQDHLTTTNDNNNNNNELECLQPTTSGVVTNCCSAHRTRSVESCEEVCRICHDNATVGNFITPCLCKGTMSLVHQNCLERWLGESGKTSCEICNYEYVTKRTPKFTGLRSIWNWIRKPINPNDTKNLLFDVACFFILTPLATISAWLCILGSQHYAVSTQERYKESFNPGKSRYEIHDTSNSTWTSIGLLTLTGTLLTAYYVWMYVAFRYHYQIWKDWQGRNLQVTIVPVSPQLMGQIQGSEGTSVDQDGRNQNGNTRGTTDGQSGGRTVTVDETIVDIEIDKSEQGQNNNEVNSDTTTTTNNK